MSTSIAELNSRVFLSLTAAAEFLDLTQVHNAVVARLNIRTMQSRNSAENVLLGTSDEFTVTDLDHDITSLIGKGVIAWVETRNANENTLVNWTNIRVVPLSQLNDYKQMGAMACAYYGDEPASATAQATQYLKFTFRPGGVCRIRFDRDGERKNLDSDTLLPGNISELIVREAQNDLIATIQTAIGFRMRSDEELRKFAPPILQGLAAMFQTNLGLIRDLDSVWRVWAFSDRAKESNFDQPTPRSSANYPGRRGGFGIGNGWGSGY